MNKKVESTLNRIINRSLHGFQSCGQLFVHQIYDREAVDLTLVGLGITALFLHLNRFALGPEWDQWVNHIGAPPASNVRKITTVKVRLRFRSSSKFSPLLIKAGRIDRRK